MPVQFKGLSEYKKHYKWFDSFRSQQFVPTPEQVADPAGKASVYASACYDPPLQHKKRLEGPPTSLSTNYFSVPSKSSEFALLGQQDKFSNNVPYQLKDVDTSSGKIYKNKENFDNPPPPSKQLKMQKRIKPLIKERHPPVTRSPRSQPASDATPGSPPLAPRKEKPAEPIKEALRDKDLKDVLGDEPVKESKSAPGKAEALAPTSNMNEFVQTDMKKGLALSGPEAPSDYALKYKAGVAPPRPPRRSSEYQKQFQWRKGMKASPLLAAEQIVYKSSTELGPYKIDPVSKVSEYKRQFQPWKPIDVNVDLSLKLDASNDSGALDKAQPTKKKAKRSKSAGAVLRNGKKEDREEDDEAGELKEKLKQTHGKIRRLGTEYHANFKAPAAYTYSKGAWKGANPPQLAPAAEPAAGDSQAPVAEKEAKGNSDPPLNTWFAEVIELRRRAEEYRKRAHGTHFSREHLVQLMAKQTDFWDLESQASSTVRALDLDAPKVSKRAVQKEEDEEVMDRDSPVVSEIDEVMLEERIQKKKDMETKKKKRQVAPRSRKMAFLEEQKEKLTEQQHKLELQAKAEEEDDNISVADDEGRRPTPILQQEKGSVRRHHLDLTTPAVGGALLTCPPSKSSKIIVTSRSGDSYVTASDDFEVKKSVIKTYNMDKLVTRPILGMPSSDTHALRDESADEDKVLATQYVPTPIPCCDEDDKENAPEETNVRKSRKSRKGGHHASKPSHLSSVPEHHGKTYPKHNPAVTLDDIKGHCVRDADDDVISVSMMSVASSCSLASEVLERARRRREEFWGKKD